MASAATTTNALMTPEFLPEAQMSLLASSLYGSFLADISIWVTHGA